MLFTAKHEMHGISSQTAARTTIEKVTKGDVRLPPKLLSDLSYLGRISRSA